MNWRRRTVRHQFIERTQFACKLFFKRREPFDLFFEGEPVQVFQRQIPAFIASLRF